MLYVETYLTNVHRDRCGWPTFMDDESKEWLTDRVRTVLEQHGHLSLDTVYRMAWGRMPDSQVPVKLRGICLWDALYAATHRALLNAKAEKLWHGEYPHHWDRYRLHDPKLWNMDTEGWESVGKTALEFSYRHGQGHVAKNGKGKWAIYVAGSPVRDARKRHRAFKLLSRAIEVVNELVPLHDH